MGRSVCKQQQVIVRNLVLVVLCVHALFPDQLSFQRATAGPQKNETYVYNDANRKFS
jgi:hypothetical protein